MVKSDGRRKRHARLPRLRPVLTAAAVLGLAAVQSPTAPAREGRIAGEARRTVVTLREGGDPRVRLTTGEDLGVALGQRAESLLADSGTPLSLASADFDGDGVPDLAAGYRLGNSGALAFWRGNVDSIHPNAPDAMRRREKGEFLESPFFPSRLALEIDEPPDWLFAGDFDGDGIADIVYAARGSSALHILPGNGAGGFRAPSRRDLPGAITAIAGGSLDPAGGTLGIAVAVLSGRGASLLFLDRGSSGTLDAVVLPSPAAALAIVRPEGDAQSEVAAACGTDLLLVHRGMNAPPGAGSVERRPLPFFAAALEAGNFGTGSREGLALMAADGQSWLLLPGEVPAPEKLVGAPRVLAVAGQKQVHASPVPYLPSGGLSAVPASTSRAASLKDWALVEMSGSSPEQGVGIRAARLSGSEADDLLVLDGRGQRIEVVSASEPQDVGSGGGARASSARTFSSSFSSSALEVAGEPAAVLPMRLNSDAISDLVVLRSGSITPAVVLSASALSLTVNSNGDTGDASPGNGICADSNGNCTLRAAIQEANASAGSDTINFAIAGAGVHTITTGSSLPPITGAVTINGTTQSGYAGTPLIEVKGATGQIGVQIQVSDCVVRGLAVNGYEATGQTGGVGIYIVSSGPLVKNALLEANFIGTDP
ncbi:MAG TPA: CSLREA domain-containing protein, partial [Thermoanaerobaculia bacterium]|nr:CSLREA domain-containing protein [Thermoanaerobaculia bacterium]